MAKSFDFQQNKEMLQLLKPSTVTALEPTAEPALPDQKPKLWVKQLLICRKATRCC